MLMSESPMGLVLRVSLVMFFVLMHRRGAPRRASVDRNNKILRVCEVAADLRACRIAAASRGQGATSIIRDEAELRAGALSLAPTAPSHGQRFRASVIRPPRYGSLEPLAQTSLQAASGRR